MIVDTPNSFNLTIGAPGRVPQEGDAQVIVPAQVYPIVPSFRPHVGGFASAVPITHSCMIETSQSRTNQAALTVAFAILEIGLWELQVVLASDFNYAAAFGGFNGVSFLITYQGQIRNVLKRLASIANFVDVTKQKLLLQNQATLSIDLPITGVGESLDAVLMINCVRIL